MLKNKVRLPRRLLSSAGLVLLFGFNVHAQSSIPSKEREALIAFYESTGGDSWYKATNWLGPPGTEAEWHGVTVEAGHVTSLRLPGNNLAGALPPEIQYLSFLQELALHSNLVFIPPRLNRITALPDEIGELKGLERINLTGNQISTLPAGIGGLTGLKDLTLDINPLSSLPPELGLLSNLQALYLSSTDLSALPVSIGSLQNLKVLYLNGIGMVELPGEIGDLSALEILSIRHNDLEELPSSVGRLSNLEELNAGSNRLVELPPEIGNLESLRSLNLQSNELASLPFEIGGLSSLKSLLLSENRLTLLPAEIVNLPNLQALDLRDNQLSALPPAFDRLSQLQTLEVAENQLEGEIPIELTRMENLMRLGFSNNRLTGQIPPEFGGSSTLRGIDFSDNQLTGTIPVQLADIRSLGGLDLSNNRLSGEIPGELGLIAGLVTLNLARNQLEGTIPAGLARHGFGIIDLSHNRLDGNIPEELGDMFSLWRLRLQGNRLSGEFPPEFKKLHNVFTSSDFRWNALYSSDPELAMKLDDAQPSGDFNDTQTVVPENIRIARVNGSTVELGWDPIKFVGEQGGYEALLGLVSGGPYSVVGRTRDKTRDSLIVTRLDVGTTYYLVIRTVTEPHANNHNRVVSEESEEVSVTTLPYAEEYFPILQGPASSFTGFAVSNPSDLPALLGFRAFRSDGGQLAVPRNPVNFQIPAHSQLALLGREIFGNESETSIPAWGKLSTNNSRIGSFFLIGSPERLDGANAVGFIAREFYFARVFQGFSILKGQDAETFLQIVNPNDHTVQVRLQLFHFDDTESPSLTEVDASIPAKGSLSGNVDEIFPGINRVAGGFVEVKVIEGAGAAGFAYISSGGGSTLIGVPAVVPGSSSSFCSAQLASGPTIFTSLKLINTSSGERSVVVSPYNEKGGLISEPAKVLIAPGSSIEKDVRDLFDLPESLAVGSLCVEADAPGLVGDILFGDPVSLEYAAALPLEGKLLRRGVFSQVANTHEVFTGLALFNPGQQSSEVTIQAFTRSGDLTDQTVVRLQSRERLSKLLSEILPRSQGQVGGYLVVQATSPIVAQQLFGSYDLTFLSAVPPTILQDFSGNQ